MLKVTIKIVENKDKDTCNVTLLAPKEKDLNDATKNEKSCTATVINQITKALNEIKE